MSRLKFAWDETKAKSNLRKHNVSFDEARSVFFDENAQDGYDQEHSLAEDRFIMVGLSEQSRVLVLHHCHRNDEIRIISARKATNKEIQYYKEGT